MHVYHVIRFVVRLDELINPNDGRSAIGVERSLLIPSRYVHIVYSEKQYPCFKDFACGSSFRGVNSPFCDGRGKKTIWYIKEESIQAKRRLLG